ncbi:hypothetical protein MPTK1_6g02260 [Marchantia polymorpha subsp. ruderalis]|uniref:Uncharacterized protein n=2 Tax=Marchantia polymorpha TaxID=3197 RepID=A0AAF6BMP0_MARPO|nr:hypothetical protein MARPO_0035s0004 [Marchantia polymorpha]BBN13274.1 hypothetical protein Mp_6g02260 [Marchantia polymorpha subsp. ruderalis]|eukprot:PTQ41192.1 hypothetical protein MARPO_0035s0004 [Marchantia polymorpha]
MLSSYRDRFRSSSWTESGLARARRGQSSLQTGSKGGIYYNPHCLGAADRRARSSTCTCLVTCPRRRRAVDRKAADLASRRRERVLKFGVVLAAGILGRNVHFEIRTNVIVTADENIRG